MANNDTLWPRDDHTLGKHLVLRSYLNGWFPILGRWNGRIVFIDGFAGPGEYAGGEPGSPVIALDCIKDAVQSPNLSRTEVLCLFMESRPDRAQHLEQLLESREKTPNVNAHVLKGAFQDHMTELLDHIDEQNKRLAPAFVMIDPNGAKGSTMELVERILSNQRSECFISFMYEPIRRWCREPGFEAPLNGLFGTDEWKRCLPMATDEARTFLHELFYTQLKQHARYVVSFELWRRNRHIYTIYFATNHIRGCDLMKASIWKTTSGEYRFGSRSLNQLVMFDQAFDKEPLTTILKDHFGTEPARIEDIDEFVMSDATVYYKGQLRRNTLQPLEREKRIAVTRPQGGRGFSPDRGIMVTFL
jgi:three-Cys-motif partner protein